MKKLIQYHLKVTLISVVLFSCATPVKYIQQPSSLSIDSTFSKNQEAAKIIEPYKTALDSEMNEVLVISAEEFPKEKGKPETKLGNLVADLSLEIAKQMYGDSIDFCLLNFGGLRTSLPKGEITRGKIFELMPFENELVVVTINTDSLTLLYNYLKNAGGQPIAGNLFVHFSEPLSEIVEDWEHKSKVKVVTSDYLAQGGDKMNFFLNPIKYEPVGIKLRDAIIHYCKEQNKQGKQLTGKLDGRISFE
ncbi:MAG: 5'-nucleotidase C-terminal domain-containing protein [Flavobacteriales bacterium]|nr:5'-nucleotidase C-terminal domain-containing protein [Flavobacteriales bacterium]